MQPDRELTYGEQAVGLTFNPSNNDAVHQMKIAYAIIIDNLNDTRRLAVAAGDSEKARLCSVAITEAQTAQMWAIKAITWKV